MAPAAARPQLLPFLLLAILFLADGERQVLKVVELSPRRPRVSRSHSCTPLKSRREGGATVFEMRHHAYCHPGPRRRGRGGGIRQVLASDEARVRYLHSRGPPAASSTDEFSGARLPVFSGIKLQTLNYVVTVGMGGKKMVLIMDTGSDLTWVQCRPCSSCYAQQEPLFDPAISPSYRPVPCNSSACSSMQLATGRTGATCAASRPSCGYMLSYGDGSYSRGELASDRIDLAGIAVDGFIFGCGRTNRGLFGGASGLLGLGSSPVSLVAQTAGQFGGVFSYCLPSRDYDASGSLVFGGDYSVYKNTTAFAFARIVAGEPSSPFYLLNLTGASLGGVPVQFAGGARFIVDSGTVITRLPPAVYAAVTAEFLRQFAAYPRAAGFSILGSCFNLTGYREVSVPALRLRFEGGAEVGVDAGGMLYLVRRDAGQACLAVASLPYDGQPGILGNYQQKNLRVVYDTTASTVGFAQETCSYT